MGANIDYVLRIGKISIINLINRYELLIQSKSNT
jgi:hypothetical protein